MMRSLKSITIGWIGVIAAIVLSGCDRAERIIPASAGDNECELADVLEYYRSSSEPQKYEAAKFLIGNMGWHVSAEYGGVYADAAILSGDFLKEHIDHAFRQWKSSPHAKGLTFDEFCEYLLPYCAARGYGNHVSGKKRYDWVAQNINIPDSITDLKELIWYYNNAVLGVRARGGKSNVAYHRGLEDLHFEDFVDCRDKAVQTCLNLRAVGVPCVVEHTIGYRTLRAHHYYCAVWDAVAGQWIRFHGEGIKYYPGDDDWTSAELLNVYRDTYAPHPDDQYRPDDFRPYRFESPCQMDVTHHTVCIDLPAEDDLQGCVPYLSTFHRAGNGLQPFTHGRAEGDRLVFDHVVPTVWYVVTIYPEGRERIVSRPFWVKESADGRGMIEYADFAAAGNEVEDIVLRRKYPVKEFLVDRVRTLIGSTIVGANRPDFSDARILWRLDSMPQLKVVNYPFRSIGNYRYYRLLTPAACEVSVLQWLTDGGEILTPPNAKNKAYDGDMTTAPTDSSAITLILPEPRRIVAVNMAPVNADNAVTPGHVYKLLTWDDRSGWVHHSTRQASADSIRFARVPKGALLWLIDATAGQEEMPMFYENNCQRFLYTPYNNHPAQYRVN